ncbi:hypothetical protein PG984_002772 [Apiospora sp. TS-2023a]
MKAKITSPYSFCDDSGYIVACCDHDIVFYRLQDAQRNAIDSRRAVPPDGCNILPRGTVSKILRLPRNTSYHHYYGSADDEMQ